jgi:hypothetical protein
MWVKRKKKNNRAEPTGLTGQLNAEMNVERRIAWGTVLSYKILI